MLPSRHLVIGTLIVLVVFIVGICVQYPKLIYETFSLKHEQHPEIISTHELIEKTIELNYCQRQLGIKRSNVGRTAALQILTPWLAPIIWDGTYDIDLLNTQYKDKTIGLFVFAVKKYIRFLGPFLKSAERYFMVGHKVRYYVFTDKVAEVKWPKMAENRILVLREVTADQRWQDVSMRRMQVLTNLTRGELQTDVDYLVCADVDMVFADHVGVEILGERVATIHPGYFLKQPLSFSYERRPISNAYIPYGDGDFYYMAAFYGGTVDEIYKLSTACQEGIVSDKKKDIEAVWQEESHLNKYLVYNKPTKVLSPEYIWDTDLPNGNLVQKKRFLAVHKNHEEVRNRRDLTDIN
ncbi:histo-blood group ABO system transferase 2-like [Spea bombifrons]|uniref:histo-blood group ABO system transferase 2-like n=1 Tax=Spea bombifrons TaxID=233779 RepID=UPI00234A943B|nr:histo-blood group ABO system transferase 2-like [Spea bombifrons]